MPTNWTSKAVKIRTLGAGRIRSKNFCTGSAPVLAVLSAVPMVTIGGGEVDRLQMRSSTTALVGATLAQMIPSRTLKVGAAASLGSKLPPVNVGLTVAPQEQGNWCWAAVSSSVSFFFVPMSRWTQCEVATSETGGNCCQSGGSATCNVPWDLDKALKRTGNLKIFAVGSTPISTVRQELASNAPLCVRVRWSDGGGHFLAINGLFESAGKEMLRVTDPIYGDGTIAWADLVAGAYQSGRGTWTHSYKTKA